MKTRIGFYSNQLNERGTTVAMIDYAYYCETLWNCESILFYLKDNPWNHAFSIQQAESMFPSRVLGLSDKTELEHYAQRLQLRYLYTIDFGNNNPLVSCSINLVHAVFVNQPHGDRYAVISDHLNHNTETTVPVVPHMIDMPICHENVRSFLGIPPDAIVLGRYGGLMEFNVPEAQEAVRRYLEKQDVPPIYFLFVNTMPFVQHPRAMFIPTLYDKMDKARFIHTCDAMLYGRSDGETFGLSIGEFSLYNKPIIASSTPRDSFHLKTLGDCALLFQTTEDLLVLFENLPTILKERKDWTSSYRQYTPEKVMETFRKVFLYDLDL